MKINTFVRHPIIIEGIMTSFGIILYLKSYKDMSTKMEIINDTISTTVK